jgi:hypothetical protein
MLRYTLETGDASDLVSWTHTLNEHIDYADALNLLQCASSVIAKRYVDQQQSLMVSRFLDDCLDRVAITRKDSADQPRNLTVPLSCKHPITARATRGCLDDPSDPLDLDNINASVA